MDTPSIVNVTFDEFYRAVYGREPLPWQSSLADRVTGFGSDDPSAWGWPDQIDIPTGLGKTTCIDVAVFALAKQVGLWTNGHRPRPLPTRIWYVVNRRVIVDTAEHAVLTLLQKLMDSTTDTSSALVAVRRALGALDAEIPIDGLERGYPSLYVAKMMGGVRTAVPPTPTVPSVILSTIPMFASRMLFSGFGHSDRTQSLAAAYAACDSLVLFDEAHLEPGLGLIASDIKEIQDSFSADVSGLLGKELAKKISPQFVTLSATQTGGAGARVDRSHFSNTDDGEVAFEAARSARDGGIEVFTLGDKDLRHPLVRKRLDSPKVGTLVTCADSRVASEIARQAVKAATLAHELNLTKENGKPLFGVDGELLNPSVGVVVNTVSTASKVHAEILKLLKKSKVDAHVIGLTGRMRGVESSRSRSDILGVGDPDINLVSTQSHVHVNPKPVIVVATQTIEVGVDISFHFLVSELPSATALTQRVGRLNRLGEMPGSFAVLVMGEKSKWTAPPYLDAPLVLSTTLAAASTDSILGINVDGWFDSKQQWFDLSPHALREIVDAVKEPYHFQRKLTLSNAWAFSRTSAPACERPDPLEILSNLDDIDRQREVSVCWKTGVFPGDLPRKIQSGIDVLSAVGVDDDDSVAVPLKKAVAVAEYARSRFVQAATSLPRGVDEFAAVVDHGVVPPLIFNPRDRRITEYVSPSDLVPGGILVLHPVVHGGWDLLGGVADVSKADVSGPAVGQPGWYRPVKVSRCRPETDPSEVSFRYKSLVAGDIWVTHDRLSSVDRFASSRVLFGFHDDVGVSDDTDLSGLRPHMDAAADVSVSFASTLGVPERTISAIRLAGRLHDAGKAHPSFQAFFRQKEIGPGDEPVAKLVADPSGGVDDSMVPRGHSGKWVRHELLSGLVFDHILDSDSHLTLYGECVEVDPDIVPLISHLIKSHHGMGRPLLPGTGREVFPKFRFDDRVVDVPTSSLPDFCQADVFFHLSEKYGPWALAFAEMLLRSGDVVSSIAARGGVISPVEEV